MDGERQESRWFAADGTPVEKDDPAAAQVEIVTYDETGREVSRTYATVE